MNVRMVHLIVIISAVYRQFKKKVALVLDCSYLMNKIRCVNFVKCTFNLPSIKNLLITFFKYFDELFLDSV